jgi:hypothetical protein
MAVMTQSVAPEVFRLPVEKIRSGSYSDSYFVLTKELLEAEGRHRRLHHAQGRAGGAAVGGFDAEKIERFEACGAPVDSLRSRPRPAAGQAWTSPPTWSSPGGKAGRELRPNPRLREVT